MLIWKPPKHVGFPINETAHQGRCGEVSGGHPLCLLWLHSGSVRLQSHKTTVQYCTRYFHFQVAFLRWQGCNFTTWKGGWQPEGFGSSRIFCSPDTVPAAELLSIQVAPSTSSCLNNHNQKSLWRWGYATLTMRARRTSFSCWSAVKSLTWRNTRIVVLQRDLDMLPGITARNCSLNLAKFLWKKRFYYYLRLSRNDSDNDPLRGNTLTWQPTKLGSCLRKKLKQHVSVRIDFPGSDAICIDKVGFLIGITGF